MAATDNKVLTGAILDVLLENYYTEKAVEDAADSAMASDISDLSDELTTYKTSNDTALGTLSTNVASYQTANSEALNKKTPLPLSNGQTVNGTSGQVLATNGDGTTQWKTITSDVVVSDTEDVTSTNGFRIGIITVDGISKSLYAPKTVEEEIDIVVRANGWTELGNVFMQRITADRYDDPIDIDRGSYFWYEPGEDLSQSSPSPAKVYSQFQDIDRIVCSNDYNLIIYRNTEPSETDIDFTIKVHYYDMGAVQ